MHELAEELLLVHDRVDTALGNDAGLGHLFHGVQSFFLFELDFPDFAETASSNDILECKVVFIDF